MIRHKHTHQKKETHLIHSTLSTVNIPHTHKGS